jgi:hypothetical protein
MTTDRTNYLNIVLMMLSAIAAFIRPFEVFLFAYAVLGPLHYLTEISWLNDRSFFLPRKRDGLPLIMLCGLVLLVSLMHWPVDRKNELTTLITYVAFMGAAVLLVVTAPMRRLIFFAVIALSFLVLEHSALCRIFFGIFLPTIIHVFVFTGAFVALGALRGRRRSAFASLAVLVLCAMSFFVYVPVQAHGVSIHVREAYAPFELLNLMIFRVFHLVEAGGREAVYRSPQGLAVMRFIAFAYLYHYLNWFSKTSTIKWNRISSVRAFAIAALWIVSLSLYAHDSGIGLMILLSLSFMHGFLELPLDHRTFVSIADELRRIGAERFRPAAPKLSTVSPVA